MRLRFLLAVLACMAAAPTFACGPDSDCQLGSRHYRIAMPEGHDGKTPVGAILFAHGYRGSAKGVMRNRSLRRMASEMGVALIALKSGDDDWVIPHAPRHEDADGSVEFNYVDAVLRDVTKRFAIDDSRIMASGFSAGGMMVWNLACAMPNRFFGFAPISGTFWLKPPKICKSPVASVVHIHGDSDPTVPLGGRQILNTHQGDVMEAIDMYRDFGNFGQETRLQQGGLTCRNRRNNEGEILDFCMFKGGHSFRTEYVRFAWNSLKKAGQF
ncbi:Phospholipase/Carboxylesterase [Roseovarius litorisediminis]|uniref:Phospholipase/Carboxylesterase n=1 Tax=Roseovarius litorisediminis TaxID=1312363 RepID=A0A1Y5SG71_9RHOB|nr:polyhydroxybutyrate depolymerase [Roseovarius litorisediminis]SLN40086.1 Phospholipase/Carboxylesterase [Roseovarius litorisediminis]